MDPATLSLAVASAIATKTVEDAAGKIGDSLWQAMTRIYDAVRAHFHHDQPMLQALDRIRGHPHDQEAAKHLAGELRDRFLRDPSFADELARLIEELNSAPETARFLTVVEGNARVGKVTNIGFVKGDISF